MFNTTISKPRAVRFAILPLGVILGTSLLGGCSPRTTGDSSTGDTSAYVPSTGSSSGVVVPNARPGMESAPAGVSSPGSSIGRSR